MAALPRLARRFRPAPLTGPIAAAAVLVAAGVASWPAFIQVSDYNNSGAALISLQQAEEGKSGGDVLALIDEIRQSGPGRVYAGTHFGWGRQVGIGFVPNYAILANQQIDAIGFFQRVPTVVSDVETHFDDTKVEQYDMFNIRYAILPHDRPLTLEGAKKVDSRGAFDLWTIPTTGYTEVVDVVPPAIFAEQANFSTQAESFLTSINLLNRAYQPMDFNGVGMQPTYLGVATAGVPGQVEIEASQPDSGTFASQVNLARPAAVVLKSGWDPRWQATVDGRAVTPRMVAPGFPAVPVPAGEHRVAFTYQPIGYYPVLFALALLTLAGCIVFPRARVGRRLESLVGPATDALAYRLARARSTTDVPWDGLSGLVSTLAARVSSLVPARSAQPFYGQAVRQQVFASLSERLQPVAAVETGTGEGETARFMYVTAGCLVYTVEPNSIRYRRAKAALKPMLGVTCYEGDSVRFLIDLLSTHLELSDEQVIFYLNADQQNKQTITQQLELIADACDQAVVIVDGFRVENDLGYTYTAYRDGMAAGWDMLPLSVKERFRAYYPRASSDTQSVKRGFVVLVSLAQVWNMAEVPELRPPLVSKTEN